jgi:CHAT domain-containing protein
VPSPPPAAPHDRYPELSGIVLSLVNEKGLPQDGFLRVQDIAGLHVDADLVVLSACETAVGHILRGEGIIGLVTAFLRAGASGVIASKWKVDDIATQQLMEEFYRGLFLRGMDSAAALRAAQVSLWKRKRTQAPFYWGAFELHGIS